MPILTSVSSFSNVEAYYKFLKHQYGSQAAINLINGSSQYTQNGLYIYYAPVEMELSTDISARAGSRSIFAK
jgi:hypothetical protein